MSRERLGARIVVGGFLGLLPAGGVTWDYLQYPLGFHELGHDVYYVEDTRLWPLYQEGGSADCSTNVRHLERVMEAFGLAGRWAYRDEASGRCFGLSESEVRRVCRTADVFVNVSCSTCLRDDYRQIPVRVLIDSDPMFTQIQVATAVALVAGESVLRQMVADHTHHFTFGENFGAPDCRMPDCGVDWRPTRQPVCLDHWPVTPPPAAGAYTTVMNWSAAEPLEYEGETWGQKNEELRRYMALPEAVPELSLALAVGRTTGARFPAGELRRRGWRVLDPARAVPDWRTYRAFLRDSRGELSIAKEAYVKGRTGWFSCRSACYLASGRPVVVQDTGWSRHLPDGEGLLAFADPDQAAAALRRADGDLARHARAARAIAEEHFDSRKVLAEMLSEL